MTIVPENWDEKRCKTSSFKNELLLMSVMSYYFTSSPQRPEII